MTSWHEPRRESHWPDFILLACAVPVLFLIGFFTLNWLLQEIAMWLA